MALTRLAQECEDVAAELHVFRDSLPRDEVRITAIIGEFFCLSSVLWRIDDAQANPRYQPSLYRIRDDTRLAIPSLQMTLGAAFSMLRLSGERPRQAVWDDLQYRMDREERLGFLPRLQCYHEFWRAQLDVLVRGDAPPSLRELRRELQILSDAQDVRALRFQRHGSLNSGMCQVRNVGTSLRSGID